MEGGLLLQLPAVLAVAAAFIALEAFWRVRIARTGYDAREAGASVLVALGQAVSQALFAAPLAALFLWAHALAPIQFSISDWRVWAAGFVAVEFAYYWMHRWSHTIRWMWASHAVHHSATQMALPAAIRLGWTSPLSFTWAPFLPLAALGFPPAMIATLLAGNLFYQFFLHTEAVGRLGPLEWVLNTPAHHRVHHASNQAFIDKNFGGVVIVFDRLFGTFAAHRPDDEPLRYGLTQGLRSHNPFVIALHEWLRMDKDMRAARTPGALWRALFGRPTAQC